MDDKLCFLAVFDHAWRSCLKKNVGHIVGVVVDRNRYGIRVHVQQNTGGVKADIQRGPTYRCAQGLR